MYELRDLANDLEKIASVSSEFSGNLEIEVNTDTGVTAVVRIRENSVRVVAFK